MSADAKVTSGWCFACIKTNCELAPFDNKQWWTCKRFNSVDAALKWRDDHNEPALSSWVSESHSDFSIFNGTDYPNYGLTKWLFAKKHGLKDWVKWK